MSVQASDIEPTDDLDAIDERVRQLRQERDGPILASGPQGTVGYWVDDAGGIRFFGVGSHGQHGTGVNSADR